jgi:hypothetical protein
VNYSRYQQGVPPSGIQSRTLAIGVPF